MIAYQRSLFEDKDIDPGPVWWVVVQCPVRSCRGADCPVIHTEGKRRNHKCRACGYAFISYEHPLIAPVAEADIVTRSGQTICDIVSRK